jgi:chromosome transmission fidelity protein 8
MSTTSVKLHPPSRTTSNPPPPRQLPTLLQTPAGLALLELQGTVNVPEVIADSADSRHPIGRLDFPEYNGTEGEGGDGDTTAWMKRVYLYVGQHQRLAGEVKKLPRALAVVRRRRGEQHWSGGKEDDDDDDDDGEVGKELEVVEVVRYKLVFAQRPEPMGST